MDGINRVDLYSFFSSVWAARIDKDNEDRQMQLNPRTGSSLVPRRDNRASLCDLDKRCSDNSKLLIQQLGGGINVVLQDKERK